MRRRTCSPFFFFNDTATTEIYTLSLHDALPIYIQEFRDALTINHSLGELYKLQARNKITPRRAAVMAYTCNLLLRTLDRKSTRLNSSHSQISYAVFCLKKKKKNTQLPQPPQAET